MRSDDIERLVLDALFDRREKPRDACLVANEAGLELARSGRDALKVIERVLQERVAPEASHQDPVDAKFIGLRYVLGAYLLISRREGLDASAFLLAMPPAVQIEAVHAMSAFFQKTATGYNFGTAPGRHLGLLLRTLADSPGVDVPRAARTFLESLSAKDPAAFLDLGASQI